MVVLHLILMKIKRFFVFLMVVIYVLSKFLKKYFILFYFRWLGLRMEELLDWSADILGV